MTRLRALLMVALLATVPIALLGASAAAAPPNPATTFTVTPNPVVAGNPITFSGKGCLRREGDPADPPLTVTVSMVDQELSAAAVRLAAPMAAGDPTTTPKADGTWSLTIDVPDEIMGDFEFSAVCDGYNWSISYNPLTLTVEPDPTAPAVIIIVDFFGSPGTPELSTGKSYEIYGFGFYAGEKVQLVLHSDPVVLVTLTADGEFGLVDGFFTLPKGTTGGAHTLTLVGTTSHKSAIQSINVAAPISATGTVTATVTVTSPAVTSPTATTPPIPSPITSTASATPTSTATSTTASVQTLASTGTAAGQMFSFGAVLTLLGAGTLLVSRRLRSPRSH